jgi:predicted RNase H-like HicB family nuclease
MKYPVDYALGDDGWWTACVRGVRGVHTQGRSIAQARRRICEALGPFVEGAEKAELFDNIRIPFRAGVRSPGGCPGVVGRGNPGTVRGSTGQVHMRYACGRA